MKNVIFLSTKNDQFRHRDDALPGRSRHPKEEPGLRGSGRDGGSEKVTIIGPRYPLQSETV